QAHALGRVGAGHIGDLVVDHETGACRCFICGKPQANIGGCQCQWSSGQLWAIVRFSDGYGGLASWSKACG
ncbi:MAG: hypothetical protein ACPH4F_05325, partial [Candidatus Puniceispirillaceae bacterium]